MGLLSTFLPPAAFLSLTSLEYTLLIPLTGNQKPEPSPDSSARESGHGNTYDPGFSNQADSTPAESYFSKSQERRLLAKIDLRLIPVLSILYLLAFVDRTNIANAAVYGRKLSRLIWLLCSVLISK